MFPFRRKKEETKDLESNKEVKKIRKRRKKEEPQKPWGKLERSIIFTFLIGIPLLSIIFFVKSKNMKVAQSLSIAPKIISKVIPAPPKDTVSLKGQLINEIQGKKGTYGIWIQAIDGGYSLGINENDQFEGASLFKLPIMIGYFEEVDKGKINPDTTYTLKYSDAAAGSGSLANLPAGSVTTYRDLIQAMGKTSDNTAFQIIISVLGINKEKKVIDEIGMTNTDFNKSLTTPYDIGLLFMKLATTNIISNNSKDELIASLKHTSFEDLLTKGIPDDIEIAHKYGSVNNVINDAGIIYANRPFILVVLSKNASLSEVQIEFPRIANLVYDWATK